MQVRPMPQLHSSLLQKSLACSNNMNAAGAACAVLLHHIRKLDRHADNAQVDTAT